MVIRKSQSLKSAQSSFYLRDVQFHNITLRVVGRKTSRVSGSEKDKPNDGHSHHNEGQAPD
jgi:hypothetical protein